MAHVAPNISEPLTLCHYVANNPLEPSFPGVTFGSLIGRRGQQPAPGWGAVPAMPDLRDGATLGMSVANSGATLGLRSLSHSLNSLKLGRLLGYLIFSLMALIRDPIY